MQCTLRGYCAIQKVQSGQKIPKVESFDFVRRRKRKQRKMPKGKAKRRREKLIPESVSPDEDSESVCSSLDGSVCSEDGGLGLGVGGEEEVEEGIQFQLLERIDQLGDKNSRTRLEALTFINKALCRKIVLQHLIGIKETVVDTLVRGLKKSRGSERCALLQLAMLLAVQLGEGHPELLTAVKPLLMQMSLDSSVAAQERAMSVSALGLCTFIQAPDLLAVESVMRDFEELFRKCKLDLVVTAAVSSWSLLLSIAPNTSVSPIMRSLLPVLNGLLERMEMSVRIPVGQALALLFELARETDEELLDSKDSEVAYGLIQQLATESNRYTGRKERNHQRSCFRDIMQTLEDGTVPERDVKLGVEVLPLDSWAKLIQYSAFRDLLGSGINTHLQGNELLRAVFQLGPPPLATVESKAARQERKYYNAALAKHRSQARAKQRDNKATSQHST